MAHMTVTPHSEWTVDDLDALPEDGQRHELVDGILLVTPAPVRGHQRAVLRLAHLLAEACSAGLEVVVAPFDWRPNRTTSLQPDLLVVPMAPATQASVTDAPLLVVEVLSPSTRRKDRIPKRAVYEDAGVPSYWIVDVTDPGRSEITVLDLVDGRYQVTAEATGDTSLRVSHPFPVTVTPSRLVD